VGAGIGLCRLAELWTRGGPGGSLARFPFV
jgi:hypothetical protein